MVGEGNFLGTEYRATATSAALSHLFQRRSSCAGAAEWELFALSSAQDVAKRVNEVSGIKESDTGLAHPSRWDLVSDRQAMQEEQPLQVSKRVHGTCALGLGCR